MTLALNVAALVMCVLAALSLRSTYARSSRARRAEMKRWYAGALTGLVLGGVGAALVVLSALL